LDHNREQEIEARYSRIAPLYDLVDLPFEWLRYRRLRRMLCGDLAGSVLEGAVGTGRNLAYYPPGVHVTGVDLNADMLARARTRPLADGVAADLREGDVTALEFSAGQFDAVVSSFLLVVLAPASRVAALGEMARVCREGGEIRLLEYQRSRRSVRRALMSLSEPWARWAFGADFDLDLDAAIEEAGLAIIESRHVTGDIIRLVRLRPQ
jgi:ubiquinone/menaquinone biosynthesis C-methylase UbiE